MTQAVIQAVIQPDVSRHVHYIPSDADRATMVAIGAQPLHAVVIFVHNERMVNLAIIDHHGTAHTRNSVQLVQPGDELPSYGGYCRWMPYQVKSAPIVLTEADSLADLNGTPRPDNPTQTDGAISPVVASILATTAIAAATDTLAVTSNEADGNVSVSSGVEATQEAAQ